MSAFIQDAIVDYLKRNAPGPASAIPRTVVMAHLCYDIKHERQFRREYRAAGVSSCDDGLYWALTEAHVATYKAYLVRHYGEQMTGKILAQFYEARKELKPKPKVEANPQLGLGI